MASRAASWLISLGLLSAAGACAPLAPSLSEVPIAIDYVWPPTGPLDNSAAAAKPDGVVIRWKPGAFSAADIQGIASQQCGLYQRSARVSGPPLLTTPLRTQNFDCVAQR